MSGYLDLGAPLEGEKWTRHGEAVSAVRRVLETHVPRQVDGSETFITGEGLEVCILVIPHHWLGGVSLVVWSEPPEVNLRWAAVTDLSNHDSIDLGHVVATVPVGSPGDFDQLTEKLEDELSRPIQWRYRLGGPAQSPQSVRAVFKDGDREITISVVRKLSPLPGARNEVAEQTSLSAAEAPRFRLPVPIAKLLRQA